MSKKMNVDATGGALATAKAFSETQVALQKRVNDMAKTEMAGVLKMIAPPPSHLGQNVNVSA